MALQIPRAATGKTWAHESLPDPDASKGECLAPNRYSPPCTKPVGRRRNVEAQDAARSRHYQCTADRRGQSWCLRLLAQTLMTS